MVRRSVHLAAISGVSALLMVLGVLAASPTYAASGAGHHHGRKTAFKDGNITCTLYTEWVRTNLLYGSVTCSAPVDKMVLEAWGEDRNGNTTWGPLENSCQSTDQCAIYPTGDLTNDHKATICGTTEWAGIIEGDCQDVPGYHPN